MGNDLDFEARELCPDGDCIGLIGANGKCKVCGKAGSGKPFRTPGEAPPPDQGDEADEARADDVDEADDHRWSDDEERDGGDDEAEADAGVDRDGDGALSLSGADRTAWDDRRLCRDGRCIGVIGPDGACKVCGTRA